MEGEPQLQPHQRPETDRRSMIVRRLGMVEYEPTWRRMQQLTDTRSAGTADELWLLEHPPVYTLGQAGRPEHVLNPAGIPVIHVDRGGQVTYHGPGQLVAYPLLDLRRLKLGVRGLVHGIEQAVIDVLSGYGIAAARRPGAPGIYVDGRKIAALGLRVRRGCTFHGLAFNVNMDLAPFAGINPCGFAGLEVTQVVDLGGPGEVDTVAADLEIALARQFELGRG